MIDVWNKDWVAYKTQLFEIQKTDDIDPPSEGNDKENNDTAVIALSIVCGVLFIALLTFVILYLRTSKKLKNLNIQSETIKLIEK